MSEKSILIVVPHYGSDSKLFRLLASFDVSTPPRFERHTVIPCPYGTFFIINNNLHNGGFTQACNEGLRYADHESFPLVWLLNNDTVVPDPAAAVGAFEIEHALYPKTGVIGAKIVALRDPDFIHHGGTTAVFPGGVHKHGSVSRGDYSVRTKERWVTGASFVISRDCFLNVGYLDENFFNYASDSDYCYRARSEGFEVVYLPVVVLHEIGESAAPSPEQLVVLRNDMLFFERKWIESGALAHVDNKPL